MISAIVDLRYDVERLKRCKRVSLAESKSCVCSFFAHTMLVCFSFFFWLSRFLLLSLYLYYYTCTSIPVPYESVPKSLLFYVSLSLSDILDICWKKCSVSQVIVYVCVCVLVGGKSSYSNIKKLSSTSHVRPLQCVCIAAPEQHMAHLSSPSSPEPSIKCVCVLSAMQKTDYTLYRQ